MAMLPGYRNSKRVLLKSLIGRDDAIAALEFALIAPVAIYTLLAATDATNALTAARHLTNAADTVGELASQQISGGLITGTVTDAEVTTDFNSIITTLPEVLNDALAQKKNWQSDIQAVVSSVTFSDKTALVPCVPPTAAGGNTTCNVVVDWSVGFSSTRQCGLNTMTYGGSAGSKAGSDVVNPSLATIPPTLFSPGTIIVVDLIYAFKPTFTAWITGPLTLERAAYLPPRFFTKLAYTPGPAASPALTHCTFP